MRPPPVAIDLCCGMGGWAEGLMLAGFRCIGFDVKNWGYPGSLVVGDVRQLDGRRFRGRAALVVASPPCTEFSYRDMAFGRARDLPPPDTSIWEACVRIAREAGLPLVLENVRGAQWFMGRSVARFGSYHLWGDVPAMLPDGNPIKGMHQRRGTAGRPLDDYRRTSSYSAKRAAYSAKIAKVPIELGFHIGTCFHPGVPA